MDFSVEYLSFFVIPNESSESGASRAYKHFQTLDSEDYSDSQIKSFLDSEFGRIARRKVEKHPNTEQAPTKIGHFIVEPGHELTSNPNYNMLQRIRTAENKDRYLDYADELVRAYVETAAVRGGALIVTRAALKKYFDAPFVFIMKCDFESNIARITDEQSLLHQVDMAINAKNMKSIQYPHMPEAGMLEEGELKIHQSSHARYFEDFLKFVEYEKSMPEIVNDHVMGMVQHYIEETWPEPENEERQQHVRDLELWAASDTRDIQQKWDQEQVQAAAAVLVEHKPEIELKFRLDSAYVRTPLTDFGQKLHIARMGNRFVVLLEGDSFRFDKEFSPVELLEPLEFNQLIELLERKRDEEE